MPSANEIFSALRRSAIAAQDSILPHKLPRISGSCLFAVFLLAIGMGCTKRTVTGVSVDAAFRPLIPPDTKALAGIQIDRLKTTPLYRRHESSLDIPFLDASQERVGLDPRRDLSDAVIVWNGKQPLFLARGRFTPGTIEQKLSALGMQRKQYRAYTLLGSDANALTFLKNVAVGGPIQALHGAIDLEARGEGEVPEELGERMRTLPKGDQIWAVSRGGLPFAELPMRSDYESALSNILGYVRGTSAGIGVDSGAHLEGYLTCVSEQGAKRVGDGLRAGLALGRLTTKDDQKDLLRFYDAFHVSEDKQIVHVTADLPGDLADKLLAYLPQLRRR
jgi:hypothetical protein